MSTFWILYVVTVFLLIIGLSCMVYFDVKSGSQFTLKDVLLMSVFTFVPLVNLAILFVLIMAFLSEADKIVVFKKRSP